MKSEKELNQYQVCTVSKGQSEAFKKNWKGADEKPTNTANVPLRKHMCKQLIAP